MQENQKNVAVADEAQQAADKKRLNLLKILWPASELGGGFNKAYFSTYASYLYTDVYMLGTVFSGILTMIQTAIRWLGGPVFGTFLDRFSFKKSKYYPWIIGGSVVVYSAWILLFALPVLGISGPSMRPVAMALAVLIALVSPIATTPISAVYPQLSKNPKDRQFFAMFQKIGRDGGKTVFGYLCPAMLVFFTARMGESNAYAITGLIIGLITIAFYVALGLGLRGSYVERNAVERSRSADGTKKKNVPLSKMFATIFTNKALLSMFLFMAIHKSYYFIYITGAAYLFKYIQNETLPAADGDNLLALLRDSGFTPDAPCGGNGICKKCRVLVDGEEVLACQYEVHSNIRVVLPQKAKAAVLTAGVEASVAMNPINPGYLAAFDIGTTTVVCFLLSPDGKEIAVESALNPQQPYGADIISRIQRAMKGDREAMTDAIRKTMTDLLQCCCEKAKITAKEICVVSVVANPCMQQLFMGMEVANLAAVPFSPVITKSEVVPAAEYLPDCINAALLIVPDISGYVGADTMGCVIATRMYAAKDTVLMVDIGTNGEMVLSHKGRMVACSTAAGPALEGANIQFGMRGSPGAIDHVTEEGCTVIGGVEAIGICGSGLIDAVAVMLDKGILNKRGRALTEDHNYFLTDKIYLTQEDIRQVQMAKGAIAAGIYLMTEYFGISVSDIDQVILAGAFGSFMDPLSACRIGLLPESLQGKIKAAGNIAGSGAKMLAMNKEQLALTQTLTEKVEFLELASLPNFQRVFAKNMSFRES